MALKTSGVLYLAILPPGSVAREINLYRRRLFRAGAGPACLAFPDCFLLQALPSGATREELSSLWDGLSEGFRVVGPSRAGKAWLLGLDGPLPYLRANAGTHDEKAKVQAGRCAEFLPLPGLPLGNLESNDRLAMAQAELPELGFYKATAAVLELRFAGNPFTGLAWSLAESLPRRKPEAD